MLSIIPTVPLPASIVPPIIPPIISSVISASYFCSISSMLGRVSIGHGRRRWRRRWTWECSLEISFARNEILHTEMGNNINTTWRTWRILRVGGRSRVTVHSGRTIVATSMGRRGRRTSLPWLTSYSLKTLHNSIVRCIFFTCSSTLWIWSSSH